MPDFLDDITDRLARDEEMVTEQIRAHSEYLSRLPGTRFCIDCDAEIPARRRELLPYVRRCVDCQTYYDQFERFGR